MTVRYIDGPARIFFRGYGLSQSVDYIIVIAHCYRCMRASHGRGPPNDPEHQWELVQRWRDTGWWGEKWVGPLL